MAGLDETTDQLELPGRLDELANALEGLDALQEIVLLRRREYEIDYLLRSGGNGAFGHVALEILVRTRLVLLSLQVTYRWVDLVGAWLLHLGVEQSAIADANGSLTILRGFKLVLEADNILVP